MTSAIARATLVPAAHAMQVRVALLITAPAGLPTTALEAHVMRGPAARVWWPGRARIQRPWWACLQRSWWACLQRPRGPMLCGARRPLFFRSRWLG